MVPLLHVQVKGKKTQQRLQKNSEHRGGVRTSHPPARAPHPTGLSWRRRGAAAAGSPRSLLWQRWLVFESASRRGITTLEMENTSLRLPLATETREFCKKTQNNKTHTHQNN